MTQIELSVEAFQELSTFVLCEVFDGPTTWNTLSAKFLERRSVEGDDQFRWLFSRLMCKMLEEHWIEKTSDIYLFEVGITFKGKTVLRHKSEISALYDRHFKCVIEKINRESKSKLKKQQDRVKKKQAQIKKSERLKKKKQDAAKKRKENLANPSKPTLVRKPKLDLFGSGKRIRSSIPGKDNDQLLKLWKSNTIGASSSTGAKRDQHLQIVSAIEKEWRRRIKELPESEAFKWPSTDVGAGFGGGDFDRREVSYLKLLGYTVGKTDGLPASARRLILDRCFSGQLPPFVSAAELKQWLLQKAQHV